MKRIRIVFVEVKAVFIVEDKDGNIIADGTTDILKLYTGQQRELTSFIKDTEKALNESYNKD